MKALTITLATLALSAHALASAPLPFAGERHFNFEQAACSEHTITIAPSGQTTVQLIG